MIFTDICHTHHCMCILVLEITLQLPIREKIRSDSKKYLGNRRAAQ